VGPAIAYPGFGDEGTPVEVHVIVGVVWAFSHGFYPVVWIAFAFLWHCFGGGSWIANVGLELQVQ